MSSSVDPEGYGVKTKTGVIAWLSKARADENPARQEKANRKKKICIALAVIGVLALLIVVGVLAYIYLSHSKPNEDAVSDNNSTANPLLDPALGNGTNSTSEPSLVEQVMKLMNRSVSPCDDFYAYACGGWLGQDEIQNTSYKVSLLSLMKEATEEFLAKLLRAPQEGDEPHYKLQPKKYFTACTNTERLEKRGLQPFLDFLKTVAIFPLLRENFTIVNYDMTNVAAALAPIGLFPYFTVRRDFYEGPYRYFYFLEPDFPKLSDEEKEMKKMWLAYNLKQLGVTNHTKIEDAISTALMIESKLQTLMSNSPPERNAMEVRDLTQKSASWIQWYDLLKMVSADDPTLQERLHIDSKVVVENWAYFQDLKNHMTGEHQLNFVLSYLLKLTLCLGPKFKPLEEFIEGEVTREQICVRMVRDTLPDQIYKYYADEIYKTDSGVFVQELVSILKEVIHNKTNENDKMNLVAKSSAMDKVNAVQLKAGYLENIQDLRILNNIFRMDVKSEFFESHISYLQRRFNRSLLYSNDAESWLAGHSSMDLNVDYLPGENYLILPAAFLQPPVTGASWPSSMKFGALGSYLSRWLVKILLDIYFNDQSNPSHKDDQIAKKCFVEQYKTYAFDEYVIDSVKSVNDNIYDYEGLTASYKAYLSYRSRNEKKEELLTGLNLDHDQLFFLAFAQMQCQYIHADYSEKEINAGNIPYKLRVLGALKNSKMFAEVYKCKPGSPMSPESRCRFI